MDAYEIGAIVLTGAILTALLGWLRKEARKTSLLDSTVASLSDNTVHTLTAEELEKHLRKRGYNAQITTTSVSSKKGFNDAVVYIDNGTSHSFRKHATAAKAVKLFRKDEYSSNMPCPCDECNPS